MNTLHHEIHCTISDEDKTALTRFIDLCIKNNIKIINVDNGITKISRHVMTSSTKTSYDDAKDVLWVLDLFSGISGAKIIRKKIEVQPSLVDYVQENEYFELHANIRVENISETVFDNTKWFVSQNADKKILDNKSLYMLTMRSYNTTIVDFQKDAKESLESFKHLLDDKEHFFIEKCIFDDNVQLDEHWMKPGV